MDERTQPLAGSEKSSRKRTSASGNTGAALGECVGWGASVGRRVLVGCRVRVGDGASVGAVVAVVRAAATPSHLASRPPRPNKASPTTVAPTHTRSPSPPPRAKAIARVALVRGALGATEAGLAAGDAGGTGG